MSALPIASAASALRDIDQLPGPPGKPFVGNALQMGDFEQVHHVVERWAREHGSMFRFRIGSRRWLGVADHAAVNTVLKSRPDVFRRLARVPDTLREMGLRFGLFSAEGEDWRRQRRMVMASFAPAHVNSYFPSLRAVTERLQRRWLKAAAASTAIPLQHDLMRYTVDGVAGLAFGSDINTLESDHEVIQQHLDKIFPALFRRSFALFAYWRYFKLPRDRDLDRSVRALNQSIDGFIGLARARMAVNPTLREKPGNLLEAMIAAADEGGSGLDDDHVAGNVLTMLLAGEDTTANTIAWMIHLLFRHPEALRRARAEVDAIAPRAEAFSPEQMQRLVYLDACASETMRLKPVASFLRFEALAETTLADVRVPEGTTLWCVMRHDSMDEKYFADPRGFRPERWLEEAAVDASVSHRRVSMPFGAGPRVCPGRHLAMLEIKMAVAMLLGRFDIECVDTADGSEARERMAFSMEPVGLRMKLVARS